MGQERHTPDDESKKECERLDRILQKRREREEQRRLQEERERRAQEMQRIQEQRRQLEEMVRSAQQRLERLRQEEESDIGHILWVPSKFHCQDI